MKKCPACKGVLEVEQVLTNKGMLARRICQSCGSEFAVKAEVRETSEIPSSGAVITELSTN